MGLVLLPYLMLPIYLLFGQRKLRPAGSPRPPRSAPAGHWAADLIESFGLAPPSPCAVRLHADGARRARRAVAGDRGRARARIDVGTFIIGDDALRAEVIDPADAARARRHQGAGAARRLWRAVPAAQAFRRAARGRRRRGRVPPALQPAPQRPAQPAQPPQAHDRRRPLALVGRAQPGGRILPAATTTHPVPWRDLSFDLQGSVATAAARQFDHDWASVRGRKPRAIAAATPPRGGSLAQFLPSGPDQTEDTAQALLIDACFRAEHRAARDHALLRAGRRPARRAAPGGAARRAGHDRDSARVQPPAGRLRARPRHARPGARRRHLSHAALHGARQGGGGGRRAWRCAARSTSTCAACC